MGTIKKGFGINEKTAQIYKEESKRNLWRSLLHNGKVNFAVITIFVVFFGLAIFFSLFPIFSVKNRLAKSSFDTSLEQKIIEDMYAGSDSSEKNTKLPLGDTKEFKSVDSMESIIREEAGKLNGEYGVYIKNLKDGEGVKINADKQFTAASLSKLFVAGAYYNHLENDPVFGDNGLDIQGNDMVSGNGSLSNSQPGAVFSREEAINEMLNKSDNTAFALMVRVLGISEIENFIKTSGFLGTNFRSNDTTPEDVGNLFEKLFLGDLLEPDYKKSFLSSLTNTISEDRIPYYLPSNITISHKIGTWDGVYSDAGIVSAKNGDIVIVVMNEGADYEEAVNFTRRLSKLVYDYFELVNGI